MTETATARAERILRDWANVQPHPTHPSVQQRICLDVKGMARDVLALSANVAAWEATCAEVVAEARQARADSAALSEVIFSLDYALGQWERHGPPEGFDARAYVHDLRAMIDQARERYRVGVR